jgi:hypothetical protein
MLITKTIDNLKVVTNYFFQKSYIYETKRHM